MIEYSLYIFVVLIVLGAYFWNENKGRFVKPTNDAEWIPNHAILPELISTSQDSLTIGNIRDTTYDASPSYTPQYIKKTFLKKTLINSQLHTSSKKGFTTHVFITFLFSDDFELAISVKPRRRVSLPKYITGLFLILNPPEILYLIATKKDVFTWRQEYLHEKISSYSVSLEKNALWDILMDMTKKADRSAQEPSFYSLISNNCFSNIFNTINTFSGNKLPLQHYSYTFSPFIDEMLLKKGLISDVSM